MTANIRDQLASLRRWILKAIARILQPDILAGAAGGGLAFVASNIGFYYFGARILPGFPAGSLMPDPLSFLLIDLYVGAGCGWPGYRAGQEIASMLGLEPRAASHAPSLAALMLGTVIALFVNLVLTLFHFI